MRSLLLGVYLRVALLGPVVTLLLTLGGTARLVSKAVAPFHILARSYKDSIFSHPGQHLLLSVFSAAATLVGVKSHCGCDLPSPMATGTGHLFSHLSVVLSVGTPETGPVRQVECKASRTPLLMIHI